MAAVVLLSLVTLALSVWFKRRDRLRHDAHETVREELFERRRRDDPGWDRWIDTLSSRERAEFAGILERYLRTVSGDERELYLDLASRMGMGEQAEADLDSDDRIVQLRALARLTLLEYPVTADRLVQTCLDDQYTREAVARLLYERSEAFRRPAALGTSVLVWGGTRPMTAWGLETLHAHSDGDPRELLLYGAWCNQAWSETVRAQVCTVLATCQTSVGPAWFEWVFSLLEDGNPRVRGAAVQAFRQTGWREEFRERLPFRLLFADRPRVRRATYRVLADWGDEGARELLQWAVIDEDDPRAQLLAVRALASLDADVDPRDEQPAWPARSWDWVRAELAAAESRRLPRRTGMLET
jgi:hypothetical protein